MNHIRQGQNNNNNNNSKRSRGRGRKPQGGNNGNRAYDSNGPDVKIRGTATHVCEKYQQLARDAITSGDRVMAENYYQHAEHYYRLIMASQVPNDGQPRPQNALGYRPDEDQEYDEDDNGFEQDQVQPQSAGQPYHQQNNNQNNNNNNQNNGGGEQRRNNNNNNNRNRNRDRDGYNNQNRNQQNNGGGEQATASGDEIAPEHAEQPVIVEAIASPAPTPAPEAVVVETEAGGDVAASEDTPRRRAPRRRRPRAEAGAEGATSEVADVASDE